MQIVTIGSDAVNHGEVLPEVNTKIRANVRRRVLEYFPPGPSGIDHIISFISYIYNKHYVFDGCLIFFFNGVAQIHIFY